MSASVSEPEAHSATTHTTSKAVESNPFENVHFNEFNYTAAGDRKLIPQSNLYGAKVTGTLGPIRITKKRLHILHSSGNYGNMRQRMIMAATTNNVDRMKEILNKGHSPNFWDDFHRTPLHIASRCGYTDVVKVLLSHRADPNLRGIAGKTALHLAVMNTNIGVVSLLLEAGSNILSRDKHGCNALQLACNQFKEYCEYKIDEFEKIKQKMYNIIRILVVFLEKQDVHEKDLLPSFTHLSLSNTSDSLQDDAKNLLAKLETMDIE